MTHSDLKQTWEMANVQFVENLRVQEEAFSRVWNILTPDQRTTVQQQQQPQVGQLIDLQSPQTSPQPTNQQVVGNKERKEKVVVVHCGRCNYKVYYCLSSTM